MQWQDEGIMLACKRFGENALKVDIFTKNHGKASGLVKGGSSTKRRAQFDIGNTGSFTWRGRLAEQLGQFTVELTGQPAATNMHNPLALAVINSISSLVHQCLPESMVEPDMYEHLLHILGHLNSPAAELMSHYVWFEVELLAASGFPLDLSKCVATGATSDLFYISPKSGCAVSKEAGAPYHDKMLLLPAFMLTQNSLTHEPAQLSQALAITSYFLEHVATDMLHKPLADARGRLLEQFAASLRA